MAENFPTFKNEAEQREWIKNNVKVIVKDPPKGGTIDLGFLEQVNIENIAGKK